MAEDIPLAHAIADHEARQRRQVLFEAARPEACFSGRQAQDILLAQRTQRGGQQVQQRLGGGLALGRLLAPQQALISPPALEVSCQARPDGTKVLR